MSVISKLSMLAAAGSGGGVVPIEEAFSTYLYTGNASTQTITNGIDLDGEGGLVWIKNRPNTINNRLFDTERGVLDGYLTSNSTSQSNYESTQLTSFNSDGFSVGNNSDVNQSTDGYASWTFRKAPRFFDVVTYTGDETTNRKINHNLGVTPGCIIVKPIDYDGGTPWSVYHMSLGPTKGLNLNTTAAATTDIGFWNNQSPTDTQFGVGLDAQTNGIGITYVAYLFANDPLGPSGDGSDGLIACGSYVGNSTSVGPAVNLGWKPQWLLVKNTNDGSESWHIHDDARDTSNPRTAVLQPNTSNPEGNNSGYSVNFDSTGFQAINANGAWNANNQVFIYIAIRAEGV